MAAGAMGGGGIISAAMELIKEKERQGDKAMDRLHDGMKTQMELTANQGSWTGDTKPSKVIKEKETVKEKVKEPESEETTPSAPASSPAPSDDKKDDKDIADMGIISLAQGAK